MRRKLSNWLWLLLASLLPATASCQTKAVVPPGTPTEFVPLLKRLAHDRLDRRGNELPWPALPLLERDSTFGQNQRRILNFDLILADKPLELRHRVVRLAGHGYPASYSVLFQNCLVALFKNGKFGCYHLPDLAPDEQLARQLNVGGWERCWLIGGRLVAQNNKGYYAYDPQEHGWQRYEQAVPFGQQPKLYEDDRYLAYATCSGEFGGTAYFYDKRTGQTHQLSATCANSIWQQDGQYQLLASLGHMMGFADCVAIADPAQLPLAPARNKNSSPQQDAVTLSPQLITPVFSFNGLQLFGGLRYQRQTLYLMHWHSTTFLATIDGKRITIVDPLFADGLYTFNPVTATYGPDPALTNMDDNDHSPVAALLWQGQQVTKVEWGD